MSKIKVGSSVTVNRWGPSKIWNVVKIKDKGKTLVLEHECLSVPLEVETRFCTIHVTPSSL